MRVTGDDIQLHGGVGFTWANDAHFLFKRVKQNELLSGGAGAQRHRLADALHRVGMTHVRAASRAGRRWPSATWPRAPGTTARSGSSCATRSSRTRRRRFRIWSPTHPYLGTVGEVYEESLRVAGGLRALGLGPGDVVAFQLPNWVEAAITFYACTMLGVTLVPIVHFYGPKEVGFILRQSRARAADHRVALSASATTWPTWRRSATAWPTWSTSSWWATTRRRRGPAYVRFDDLRARGAHRRPGARRPGRRGAHRLHVGHDGRPQGRRAHAPHPRLRGAPAVGPPGHARPAEPRRRPGRPRHRDAGRPAVPARQRASPST